MVAGAGQGFDSGHLGLLISAAETESEETCALRCGTVPFVLYSR